MGFEDKKSHTQLLVPVNILASSAKLIMFSHIKTATATVLTFFKSETITTLLAVNTSHTSFGPKGKMHKINYLPWQAQ